MVDRLEKPLAVRPRDAAKMFVVCLNEPYGSLPPTRRFHLSRSGE